MKTTKVTHLGGENGTSQGSNDFSTASRLPNARTPDRNRDMLQTPEKLMARTAKDT